MVKNFFNALSLEFKGYNAQKLSKDLMAGVTVAAVALPLALAFGVSAGATAAAGLVTAIIAGIVISMLTGGYYQISGPTGAMAAILGSLVAGYGLQGVFIAGLMSGVILVIAGILHLGELTSFVPSPVITGFTSGIAVVIALGQIDNFFGTHSEGATAVEKLFSYKELGFTYCFNCGVCGSVDGGIPQKVECCCACFADSHCCNNCFDYGLEVGHCNRWQNSTKPIFRG